MPAVEKQAGKYLMGIAAQPCLEVVTGIIGIGQGIAAGEGLDHLAFRTPHLGEAIRELRKQEIPIVEGPIGDPGGAWAYVEDPNGIWIELIGPLRKKKRKA